MPSQSANSPQYKELTTSNDGRNVRPSLQMTSQFFIEDNVFTQAETNAFGNLSASEFPTTAKITFSGSKKIYAICQGQIFLQPQTGNNDKVNIILKPFKQPINGLSIKYFIYRGLNKSDFFNSIVVDGSNRLKITGDENTGSGFVKYIWKEFNKFYSSDPANKPLFLEQFIGFPATSNDQMLDDLIDKYFFKIVQYDNVGEEESQFAYELPLIPRGTELGTANGDVGIDVVLNRGDYYVEDDSNPFKFNLEYARSPYYKLSTLISNSAFENKLVKEMCTQFLDIAAFYGLHTTGVGKIFIGSSAIPITSKDEIYNLIKNFYTKNTVYFYIQGERLRSYNFYGNYVISETNSDNIKIDFTNSNFTDTTFETSGWPIYKSGDISGIFAIKLLTDNSEKTTAFVQIGSLISENEDNFIRKQNILEEISQEELTVEAVTFTLPLIFQFPLSGSNQIASLVQIVYEGSELFVKDISNDSFNTIKDIDDIFGSFKAKSFIVSRSGLELPILSENQVQIIDFPNALQTKDVSIIKTRRIFDAIDVDGQQFFERITYETILDTIRQETGINLETTSANIDSVSSGTVNYQPELTNNFYQPESPYYLQSQTFTDENLSVEGLSLNTNDSTKSSKKILGISKTEYQYLLDLVTQENLTNSRIFFKNILDSEDDKYLSPENISFKKYLLLLTAENSAGELKIFSPTQNVLVYTVDEFIYFSASYSQFVKSLEPIPSTNFEMPDL